MNIALLTSEKPLRVSVQRIKNNLALLILPDKQQFEVNIKYLPRGTKVGEVLFLSLINSRQLQATKEETAKAVLEEILG